MDQWYAKDIGDGMMAYVPLGEMQATFTPQFEAAGKPDDMAIFKRHDLGSALHCQVTAYFSPAAATIARACAATPCSVPDAGQLTLVAGNSSCWAALFRNDSQA